MEKQRQGGAEQLWLLSLPPTQLFIGCVFFSLAAILLAAFSLASQPFLGGQWLPVPGANNGLLLDGATSFPHGAEKGPVRVQALRNEYGSFVLHREVLLSDPDQYSTYGDYNHFLEEQGQLAGILRGNEVELVLADDRTLTLPVQRGRSLFSLPLPFWIYSGVGMLCFLISAGVWSYRRGNATSRLLVISGFSFFCALLCLAIYGERELAIDATFFRTLSTANHFFIILFSYALLLLFCNYPCRIANRKATIALMLLALLVWLNQSGQWYEPPVHAYFLLNHIVPYGAAIVLGIAQWFLTSRQPVNRAVLRWFILSIWITIGGAGAMFIVPSLAGQPETIPLWLTTFGVLAMFVFFALGILRCGLFGLEKWWFASWVWLITGAVVLVADLLVVALLHIKLAHLVPVSFLLVGWLYFPVRYWVWDVAERRGKKRIDDTLPALLQTLFNSGSPQDIIGKWPEMLKQLFSPLELTALSHPVARAAVGENGLVLEVPGLVRENGWQLIANHGGKRLFGPEEEQLVTMIHNLTRTVLDVTERILDARLKGAERERERIMRDLHDDVLPKLITLKQRSTPPLALTADSAFQSLRDCIYLLRSKIEQPVLDVLADWRAEVAERLEPLAITFTWSQPDDTLIPPLTLTALQQVNGNRILHEAISNILKHAEADQVKVAVEVGDFLAITVIDNGKGILQIDDRAWQEVGARNMVARIRELGGRIRWNNLQTADAETSAGLAVGFSFPLASAQDQTSPQGEHHA